MSVCMFGGSNPTRTWHRLYVFLEEDVQTHFTPVFKQTEISPVAQPGRLSFCLAQICARLSEIAHHDGKAGPCVFYRLQSRGLFTPGCFCSLSLSLSSQNEESRKTKQHLWRSEAFTVFQFQKHESKNTLNQRKDRLVSGFSKSSIALKCDVLPFPLLYFDRVRVIVAWFNYRRFKPALIEMHKALLVQSSRFPFTDPNFEMSESNFSIFLSGTGNTDTQFSVVSSSRDCLCAAACTGTVSTHTNCKHTHDTNFSGLGFDSWLVLVPLLSG